MSRSENETSAITVRTATPGDLVALRDIFRRASLNNEGDRAALLGTPEVLVWDGAGIDPGQTRLAVDPTGRVLGFATVRPIDGGLELDDLFVAPEVMRRGVATLLIRDAIGRAARAGAPWIDVIANPHAAEFYASVGFAFQSHAQTRFGPAPRLRLEVGAAGSH
jgi:GNAT superfamily N-acetyltransferase